MRRCVPFKIKNFLNAQCERQAHPRVRQYQYSSCCECECCSSNCTCTGPGTGLVCVPWAYPLCSMPLPAGGPNVTCRIDGCNVTAVPQCDTGRTFQNSDGTKFTVFKFVDPCDANCRWDNRHSFTQARLLDFPVVPTYATLASELFRVRTAAVARTAACTANIACLNLPSLPATFAALPH